MNETSSQDNSHAKDPPGAAAQSQPDPGVQQDASA
jgi:hypothetical protein